MVNLSKYSGLPWDAILGAEHARAYKPQPKAYLCTASALDLKPSECLMVAAHNKDLHAARNLGFQTAYINRPVEYGEKQKTDLFAEEDWDYVCNTLLELALILKGEQ